MSKQKNAITLIICCYTMLVQAQYTAIPDIAFEAFLIQNGYDSELVYDGQILTSDIDTIETLEININSIDIYPIENLTGIQDFSSLENFSMTLSHCEDIDFGPLMNLKNINCFFNSNLESINLTQCPNLETVLISDNIINFLDFTQNILLTEILVSNNNLFYLDFRNNNNNIISQFNTLNNPNLQCIFVDDIIYSNANWTNIDPTTTFVETQEQCDALSVNEFTSNTFKIYPNPTSNLFKIDSNNAITEVNIFDISGKKIKKFEQSLESYNVSDLNNGIYFLKIKSSKGIISKKLIINN